MKDVCAKGSLVMAFTYEWIRFGQRRNIIDDVAVREIAVNVVLAYLIEFPNEAEG